MINSAGGRIGHIWWLNSNTTPRPVPFMLRTGIRGITWGTFGIGRDLRITWEQVE